MNKMDYILKAKKGGKWWIFGNIKTNGYGNNQASLKISDLKTLIAEVEKEGKSYLYFSLYDALPKPIEKPAEKTESYADNTPDSSWEPIPF